MTTPRRIAAEITSALAAVVALAMPPAAAAQGGGPVLVVGDSLEVGTEPYLRQELAGVDLTVDAQKSRPSGDGVSVLQGALRPDHEVVVFDLGTNDDPANPGALSANLEAARGIAGDRCMVVATINRPPLGGVSDAGLNSAISSFAASGNVEVADWRSAAGGPGVLQPDGVHATAEGYALRAGLVADAVESCFAGSGGGIRPPRNLPAPGPARFGPGFSLLDDPLLAIFRAAARTLAFAYAPIEAARETFESTLGT